MKNDKQKNNKKLIQSLYLVLFFGVMIALSAILYPLFASFRSPESLQAFEARIDSFGVWGAFALVGMQVLQIIVALIPGEIIEFVSGAMFGTLGGTALCLIGCFIGTCIIFFSVRRFGLKFINNVTDISKLEKYKFFNDEHKLILLVTILFLIPGTPKDLLIYAVALTKIKAEDFLIISTGARIPTIITSAYAGAALSDGDYIKTIIVYIITTVLSIAGMILTKIIIEKKNKRKEKRLSK